MFDSNTISQYIKTPGINLIYVESCSSTNTLLKELAQGGAPEKTVIIAAGQSAGRGRLGRSFFSPEGCGLYMSILLHPELKVENALEITTVAGVTTARVIRRHTSMAVGIKWVNDIYISNKKVCGILTESSVGVNGTKLDYAVLGIGINLFTPNGGFPEEISDIACSLFDRKSDDDIKSKLAAEIIDAFFEEYSDIGNNHLINEYRDHSIIIGKDVNIITGYGTLSAKVIGINDNYSLDVICDDGKRLTVNSGDVSIKIKK
ncbi:MAG: biotin--[Clostridia bacterium]|nr:biotin--[acetyl-CoA-carboxylase] ligase [Clostridia bacterium]